MNRFLTIASAIFLFLASVACAQSPTRPDPLDVEQAIGLVRTLNTIQSIIYANTKSYASQSDMITGQNGLKSHLNSSAKHRASLEWAKQVNFSSNEILPGWMLDFANTEKGYRLVLTGAKEAVITDETGIIYRAVAAQSPPKAADLRSARDFPGAVPLR